MINLLIEINESKHDHNKINVYMFQYQLYLLGHTGY